MKIKEAITIGALGLSVLTSGCGQVGEMLPPTEAVDQVPNGVYNITGPTGADCDIEVTDTTFVVNKDCVDLIDLDGFADIEEETTTGGLPLVTDWNSVKDLNRLTEIIVKSDPTKDFALHSTGGFLTTKEDLTVFFDLSGRLDSAARNKYRTTTKPITFKGVLTSKNSVFIDIIDAVIVE